MLICDRCGGHGWVTVMERPTSPFEPSITRWYVGCLECGAEMKYHGININNWPAPLTFWQRLRKKIFR